MPATLPVAQILDDPEFRTMPRLLPWYLSPKNAEEIFINPRDDFPPPQMGPARQRMIADAGDDSPALMEIAQILSTGSPQAPTRIDLSSMPGARTRGEVSRIDLSRPQDYEPQTVNREAKRDSLASVETPSMARGITQEALGQAMLMGYGDDIEGWLKGRHPEDIRRERLAFGDENPEVALGANVAGIAAGGLGGRLVKGMIGGARAARELDDELPSRLEVDVRQAMRNASDVEAAAKPIDDLADQLQRLLSNPETRLDIQGKPLELSPSQIFAMTADAQTAAPPEPQADELDMTGLSPIDRLRMNLELGQAAGQNLTEDEKARNAEINREALLGVTPIVGNWMAAKDAGTSAGEASASFARGDTRAGLMQSALAALSGFGAVTGLPTSKAAGAAAKGASSRAGVFVPVEDAGKIDAVRSRRLDDVPLREIYHDTGAFIDPSGKVLREIPDYPMGTGMGRFRPGDQATLGEYADHPVFDLFPQYRDLPVTFTDFTDVRGGAPIARTLPDGGVELSLAPGDPRKGVAKVLQYNIAKDTGLPPSLRHGKAEALEGLQRGPRLMSGVKPGDKADLEALAAYIETMNTKRQDLLRNLELVDPKKASTLVQLLVNKNAGNVNSRVASGRATLDSQGVKQIYPYNKQTPYFKRGGGRGITDYEDMFVLPPEGASDEQLLQFLREWRTYGAGRPPAGG